MGRPTPETTLGRGLREASGDCSAKAGMRAMPSPAVSKKTWCHADAGGSRISPIPAKLRPSVRMMRPDPLSPRLSAWLVMVMLAMVVVPAGITLRTVRVAAVISVNSPNPTPRGYTWSLLLFVVPILVIGAWLVPSERVRIPRRAFWWTIGILTPIGFALDIFFASRFFVFPNRGATLGIESPVVGGVVPVEEFVFYFTGFLAMLLIYVWLDEYWLAAYNVAGPSEVDQNDGMLKFHPASVIVGLALLAAAILYKKLVSPYPEGFPGYFTVLVIGGIVPSAGLFDAARRFINWRAFSLTMFMIVLVSMLWEATLAVPYGWWGYQPKEMIGLSIGAWSGLPIEAVLVWLAVTYGSTIVYAIVKVWLASGKTAKVAFFGEPAERRIDQRMAPS